SSGFALSVGRTAAGAGAPDAAARAVATACGTSGSVRSRPHFQHRPATPRWIEWQFGQATSFTSQVLALHELAVLHDRAQRLPSLRQEADVLRRIPVDDQEVRERARGDHAQLALPLHDFRAHGGRLAQDLHRREYAPTQLELARLLHVERAEQIR